MQYTTRWVIVYGYMGSTTAPLEVLDKNTLIAMIQGDVEWRFVDD